MGSVGSVAELKDGMVISASTWPFQTQRLLPMHLTHLLTLLAAVKDALQRKGLLSQLQANVRSQIFNVLLASEVGSRLAQYQLKLCGVVQAADPLMCPVF